MNEVVLHTLANWASPEGKDRSVPICHGRVGMRASCPICFFERSCESVFSSNILEFWDVTALPEHSVGHCIEGPVWPRIPIFWSLNQYLICRFPEYVPWGESFGPGGRWKTFLALIVALPLVSWMPLGRGTSVDLTSLVVKYESKLGNLRFPLIYSLIFLCMYFSPDHSWLKDIGSSDSLSALLLEEMVCSPNVASCGPLRVLVCFPGLLAYLLSLVSIWHMCTY